MRGICEEKNFDEKDSYFSFLRFHYMGYEYAREESIDFFTEEVYDKLFEYIHTGRELCDYFYESKYKEIRKYCWEYGFFSENELEMIKSLVEKRKVLSGKGLTINEILEKYQQVNVEVKLTYEELYTFYIREYADNDKRLNQIFSFNDPNLLFSYLNLLMRFDMPKYFKDSNRSLHKDVERLIKMAPHELSNTILNCIRERELDKIASLLQDKQSNLEAPTAYSKYIKPNIHLTWEDTVREIIMQYWCPFLFFVDFVDAYRDLPCQLSSDYEELNIYDVTFPILKMYLHKKQK